MSDALSASDGPGSTDVPGDTARVLVVTLLLNLAAAATKGAAGLASGSLALMAGAIDSFFDAANNVAALVVTRLAHRPPDEGHPYGHRKFESMMAGLIGGALFMTCGRLAWDAVGRLLHPGEPPLVTPAIVAAPVVAVIFNVVAAAYEQRAAVRLRSDLLAADATHTWADAAVSAALIAGLLGIRAGHTYLDPVMALGIAVVVAWAGWGVLSAATAVLADAAVIDPNALSRSVLAVAGVQGVHKIRSRGPLGAVAVDLHIQVDPRLRIARAHDIGHAVSTALRHEYPQVSEVVVHVEPGASLDGQRQHDPGGEAP